jgi:hypothetical protein
VKKEFLFERAIELRKNGHSLNQITKELEVAKSTASSWVKNVSVTDANLLKLQERSANGILRSIEVKKAKRLSRDQFLQGLVGKELFSMKFDQNIMRLVCACLYWAEGGKTERSVNFTNSDPDLIQTFLMTFRGGFEINDEKLKAQLHLHGYHNRTQMLKFWSGMTGIPTTRINVYNKPNSGVNIRKDYPGCISIRYYSVELFVQIQAYYKMFSTLMGV